METENEGFVKISHELEANSESMAIVKQFITPIEKLSSDEYCSLWLCKGNLFKEGKKLYDVSFTRDADNIITAKAS